MHNKIVDIICNHSDKYDLNDMVNRAPISIETLSDLSSMINQIVEFVVDATISVAFEHADDPHGIDWEGTKVNTINALKTYV